MPRSDVFDVYAWWRHWPTRATNAPYTIFHSGGSTTVPVNQQVNLSTWFLLSSFAMAPGQNHRVELSDVANGEVVADAIRLAPRAEAKLATWPLTVATTGSYKVYAKWPALPGNGATDAPFTVTHAGGSTVVTANQRVNGGQWNLLGSFTFNAGTAYKVELSDAVAAGKVAADAIYYVRDTAPTDAFTWTPTFPSAGTYALFARWPASSANTGAASYAVTHAAATTTVTANQKQNGGSWVPLGSWTFTPGAGHKVTLTGSSDGTTIADALLFVASGAQPANLLYVHPDHLGSPQKLTDAAQATVWDGVFDPFGEEVTIAGLAAMPMRFPGQYADDETGYSYNYFRDYEPTLGRYLQSDPIGLLGGINTYGYAYQSPILYIDPKGNFGLIGCLGGMLFTGGLDFLTNLYEYDGDAWKAALCVDLTNLALGCLMGALLPTGTDVLRGLVGLRSGASTVGEVTLDGMQFLSGGTSKWGLNQLVPSITLNDIVRDPDCNCQDKNNLLPEVIQDLNEMLY